MLIAFVLVIAAAVQADDIIVLKQGRLRGHRLTSRKGREIFAFQGIPYAKPPVGELRFRPPQLPEPWNGTLDATKDGSECVQGDFFNPEADIKGQEDCLYLNVYTPQEPGTGSSDLDVMFWIHGGGWLSGSGGIDQFGPQYLLDKDVVLVSINYRLGALGFLSTGDSLCPGNNGMKDQVAALRWVRDNIAKFGGNPNSVTVFGESAGGASAHYLMLSPASRGLFHRAISQSGTAFVNWALAPNGSTTHHTRKLASLLRCPSEPTSALLSCLRKKDAADIASTDKEFMEWEFDPMMPFNMVLETEVGEGDEAFLPFNTREAIRNASNQHPVPWMVGLTSGEGAIDVSRIFRNATLVQDFDHRFNEILSMAMFFRETAAPSDVNKIAQQIRKFYFGDRPVSNETAFAFRDMYTDGYILFGTDEAVKLHSQKDTPVYYYYFDYRGTNSYSTLFMDGNYGVAHQDELLYLFPQDHLFPNATRTAKDDQMVELLTTLWTNFAHTGNPTPKPDSGTWTPVSSPQALEFAHIDGDGLHMGRELLKERAEFWESLPLYASNSHPKHE
ncbi:juvenile hormone esterase-like [Periplaneta americana]|uniref:juvenile hormone esterase-like n=1 Tax=Periplaneta americana TaxID=6978 RepID=UPI0037E921F3